jgi:glycine dehydrogenase|tara:strand:- start:22061 stop:24877 length:2817 start_codon:yes stop_codon:yes gene_type:complete
MSEFHKKHIGPSEKEVNEMLQTLGCASLNELLEKIVPKNILDIDDHSIGNDDFSENDILKYVKNKGQKNSIFRSLIGQGYYDTITPNVILRNILENPGWYTQYTPYQPEISQGRLEALLNYQTMITEITSLPISNASLLDEGTAASEAMLMLYRKNKSDSNQFLVDETCFDQTIDVIISRAKPLDIDVIVTSFDNFDFTKAFGCIVQYPNKFGKIAPKNVYTQLTNNAHEKNCKVIFASDLMCLQLFESPGNLGADIAVGNSQRFGVPLGYGGPHAAFMSTSEEFKRDIPGRIVGVSQDRKGNQAYRLTLQTREQHIRREKATSNICTAQVLLAIISGMYALFHGPKELKNIALRIHNHTKSLAKKISVHGHEIITDNQLFFDTIVIKLSNMEIEDLKIRATKKSFNLMYHENGLVGISLDEKTNHEEIEEIASLFENNVAIEYTDNTFELNRKDNFLSHPIFHSINSETEMLRYISKLEKRDLSLNYSMIPLGSCTMKLNATVEMIPISWTEFNSIHPFAPLEQTKGYIEIINELEEMLYKVTGFDAVSFQPNSGAQGEYAGLLSIREYHKANDSQRNICLIPESAHGTNPASAIMAGLKVVIVKCDKNGNIDFEDLTNKVLEAGENLSSLMVTYPSTHGVFEHNIDEICDLIHQNGGLVYMDGANLNAMVGVCKPGKFGADVMHINLHKTFCIPHGGGGPGMGPICVNEKLKPHLPKHKFTDDIFTYSVSSSPFGSASILLISYIYMKLMASKGLLKASQVAILSANYMAKKLENDYSILYKGHSGLNAHEFIVDCREFKNSANITNEDIAKRLIDYGFHAPTMSWPIPGTLMIEPTESESKSELDKFCNAMISIKKEINDIISGASPKDDNVLVNAPHTVKDLCDSWEHPYSKEEAVFPMDWIKENKFWPFVSRIDNAFGDRNFFCVCPDIDSYK